MNREGFTLLELMIVILIISILITVVSVTVIAPLSRAKTVETAKLIQDITVAINAYHDHHRFGGDYPPTSLRSLGISTNGINDGIESVVVYIFRLTGGDTFIGEVKEKHFGNTDNDSLPADFDPDWVFGDKQARELLDSWGNPIIYFHHRDYKSPPLHTTKYKLGNKKYIRPKPQVEKKKNMYPNWNSFMLWSCGPNGKNENGEGDDVTNWK